jgi:hypothetical protein
VTETIPTIETIERKLIEMTEWHLANIDDCCKPGEPSVIISVSHDWNGNLGYGGEIYSYCLNITDAGRHHYFEAPELMELILMMDLAVDNCAKEMGYEFKKP